ncbi:MAG: xanthine dehydrogenase large subunit, partial [Caballeronia sp.]|nr:xanthine dehydrogenase large subunit [Caballeronia sp.]
MNKRTDPHHIDRAAVDALARHAGAKKAEPAAIGVGLPHESATLHVSGEATYVDDIGELRGTLHAALGLSRHAHARIVSINLDLVLAAPG